MPCGRQFPIWANATGSTGRRPTRWRAWPLTCASTSSWTRRTGSWGRSSPSRSSRKEAVDERHRCTCGRGGAAARPVAARAAPLRGARHLGRDHSADRRHGSERSRPGRARWSRRAARLSLRCDRDRARLVRVRAADALPQPRRVGVRARGAHGGPSRGLLRLLGSSRHLHGVPRRELRRDRTVGRVVLQRHRDLGQPGLGDHLACRRGAPLVLRIQRHQGGHAFAAQLRVHLRRAGHDPDCDHLCEGHRGPRAQRTGLHAQAVRARERNGDRGDRVRIRLRPPLLRGLRGRRRARRGDEQPPPQCAPRHRGRSRLLRRLLHARDARPVARLRHRQGRDRGVLELVGAARGSLKQLRRERNGRRDQLRRDDERVRERTRVRGRRVEAPVRARPERIRDHSPRRYVTPNRPINSLAVVMVFAVVVGVALRINGTTSVNAFFYMGTIGVLSMLIAYIVTNLGAMRFLHLGRREAAWRVIVPILAIAALVYTLYKNLWPRPPHPYNLFPYFVAGWLVLGIAITLVFPGLAHRIGRNLSRAEGIDTPPGDPKG